MVVNLSLTVHAVPMCMLISLSEGEILLPTYLNWSINFRGLPFNEVIIPSWIKRINSVCFGI